MTVSTAPDTSRATPLEKAMLRAYKTPDRWSKFDPGYAAGVSSGHAMCSYIRNGKATAQKKGWVPQAGWTAEVRKDKDGRPVVFIKYAGEEK